MSEREKIAQLLCKQTGSNENRECENCPFNGCIAQRQADTLIAAGIGDMGKYNRLAYEVRCNLTSVTRYIHNKNKQHNKKYKELAEKAVNNLLDLVNNHTQQAEKELAEEKGE